MKKKIFAFLAVISMTLSGCSFSFSGIWNGFLEFIGIRKKADDTPPNPDDHKEEWTLKYSSNAYEHWYIDEAGQEHRESHDFESVKHTDKSCTDVEHEEFKCKVCEYTKIVNGHDLEKHVYTTKTTLPTCSQVGSVEFTCVHCGEHYSVELEKDAEAHKFVLKTTENGVSTYECSLCKQTKKIMDHTNSVVANNVSTAALQEVDEIKLQNASIAFDESILQNDLGTNVNISAESKAVNEVAQELSLESDAKAKLEGKPIVDFSVTNSDSTQKISEFSGKVKVTIPYEIQKDEDPDGIAIWYLQEGAEPEAIKASYNNGDVTFETDHFSYYAVVHLTPEESCKKFGHVLVNGKGVASTCAAHGYDEIICRRCKYIETKELPLIPHSYEATGRLDPTETSEGYVHYECSVCQDSYDVIVPALPHVDRGFYVNLLYSMLDPDWRIYSSQTQNGVNESYEQVTGLDYEGQLFEYSSSGYALYKGYSYSDTGYSRYKSSSSGVMETLTMIRDIIDSIPAIYKDKVEEVAEWYFGKYMIQKESPEGYEFTFNFNAVEQTYNDFKTLTLGQALSKTIGKDAYDEIFNFIATYYESTVGELLIGLKLKGYDVELLYDGVIAALTLNGIFNNENPAPSFEDFIAPYEPMTVLEVIEMLIGDETHVDALGNETSGSPGQSQSSGGSGGPVYSGEGSRSKGMLPPTYVEFKEMLDQYLGMNAFDLIAAMSQADIDEIFEMYDLIIKEMKDGHYDIVFKTTKNGGFLSLEAVLHDMSISIPDMEVPEYAYAIVTKSYDKPAAIAECVKLTKNYELNKSVFALDKTNTEWYIKPYEDYYSKLLGKECKFTYYQEYGKEIGEPDEDTGPLGFYDAYVSNFEIDSGDTKWNPDTGSYEPLKGKLILRVQQQGEKTWEHGYEEVREPRYGSVITNRNKLGTVLADGEIGLHVYSSNYRERTTVLVEGDDSIAYERYVSNVPSFEYLYNVSTSKMIYSIPNGTFSYMYDDYEKPFISSWDEYDEYYLTKYPDTTELPSSRYSDEEKANRVVLKVINQLDSSIYFTVQYVWEGKNSVFSTRVLSKEMNDEALQLTGDYRLRYYYNSKNTKLVESVYCDGYENRFDFDYEEDHWYYSSREAAKPYSYEAEYGNVKVNYEAKSVDPLCDKLITYKISVNGKTIVSGSHKTNIVCEDWINRVEDVTKINDCKDHVIYHEYCTQCGKLVREGEYDSEHHTYNSAYETVLEPTLTKLGVKHRHAECSVCGEEMYNYYTYVLPCSHGWFDYDDETHLLTCRECGYEVVSPNGVVPEFIYEVYSEDADTITYSVYTPHNTWRWGGNGKWLLNTYYDFYLGVGYVDENGDLQVLDGYQDANIQYSYEDFDESYGRIDTLRSRTLSFNKSQYQALLTEASGTTEEELVPVIAAAAKDSGTVFYYAIY